MRELAGACTGTGTGNTPHTLTRSQRLALQLLSQRLMLGVAEATRMAVKKLS